MNELTDKEFSLIRDFIKDNYGISLNDEKKSLLFARLRPLVQKNNFNNFMDYFEFVKKDKTGADLTAFVDKVTTNHTYFMRETDHFYYYRDNVLPYLEQNVKDKDLRTWCAASSSGEEPYTLAMLIHDKFPHGTGWNTQLLATDISTNVLSKAQAGIYAEDQIKTLPDAWKKKYFKKYDNDRYIVCDELRNDIVFRKFNLMDEKLPFKKKFHTIFCRNVMIYFDAATRDALVNRMYEFTEPGGYLFIGHSETLNYSSSKYKYIMPAVYRRQP